MIRLITEFSLFARNWLLYWIINLLVIIEGGDTRVGPEYKIDYFGTSRIMEDIPDFRVSCF